MSLSVVERDITPNSRVHEEVADQILELQKKGD